MPARRSKPSTKGIPKNLRSLARQGERVRFNGGWLGDSERDRIVARFLDSRKGDAWSVIKDLICMYETGRLVLAGDATEIVSRSGGKLDDLVLGEAAEALSRLDL